MNLTMSHRVLTTHVPSALAKKVDSRGWILKAERTRHELTLEALAEVDAGQTDPHEEVVRWAASLRKSPRKRR